MPPRALPARNRRCRRKQWSKDLNVTDEKRDKRVDVRIRRTLSAGGSETSQLTVFCPVTRRSRALGECEQCDACEQITIDPMERNSFVSCAEAAHAEGALGLTGTWQALVRGDVVIPPEGLRTPVLTLMTKDVVCLRPDLTVDELTMILFEHGISGAPVVNEIGKPLGVVSKTDLLRESYEKVEISEDRSPIGAWSDLEDRSGHPRRVCDIMSSTVSYLPEDATVGEAGALMALDGVRRIPILNDQDQVVGIICASDILSWLARQAGYVVPARFPIRR